MEVRVEQMTSEETYYNFNLLDLLEPFTMILEQLRSTTFWTISRLSGWFQLDGIENVIFIIIIIIFIPDVIVHELVLSNCYPMYIDVLPYWMFVERESKGLLIPYRNHLLHEILWEWHLTSSKMRSRPAANVNQAIILTLLRTPNAGNSLVLNNVASPFTRACYTLMMQSFIPVIESGHFKIAQVSGQLTWISF